MVECGRLVTRDGPHFTVNELRISRRSDPMFRDWGMGIEIELKICKLK